MVVELDPVGRDAEIEQVADAGEAVLAAGKGDQDPVIVAEIGPAHGVTGTISPKGMERPRVGVSQMTGRPGSWGVSSQ